MLKIRGLLRVLVRECGSNETCKIGNSDVLGRGRVGGDQQEGQVILVRDGRASKVTKPLGVGSASYRRIEFSTYICQIQEVRTDPVARIHTVDPHSVVEVVTRSSLGDVVDIIIGIHPCNLENFGTRETLPVKLHFVVVICVVGTKLVDEFNRIGGDIDILGPIDVQRDDGSWQDILICLKGRWVRLAKLKETTYVVAGWEPPSMAIITGEFSDQEDVNEMGTYSCVVMSYKSLLKS